jgi:hypothetical protein
VILRLVDLKKESKELIDSYVSQGLISKDKAYAVWMATSTEELVTALQLFLELDNYKIDVIWRYVRTNVWRGVFSVDEKLSMFNEYDSWFFEQLLANKGLLSFKQLLDLFPSPHLARKTAFSLIQMKIIEKKELTTNEVFFMLRLDFYQRCLDGN